MNALADSTISGVLGRLGLFDDVEIRSLLKRARETGIGIAELVVSDGRVEESMFLERLGEALGLPVVDVRERKISQEALEALSTKAVFQYGVLPLEDDGRALLVACSDPWDSRLGDGLRLAAGRPVRLALAASSEIAKAMKRNYGVGADTVDRMMTEDRFKVDLSASLDKVEINELDQEASVVKFVNQIVWEACQQEATDIHVEPMENQLRIRYRVDGLLHQTPVPPQLHRFQAAIISRIKVMANLDIAEKRLPMDGRIGLRVSGQDIDIRVSTMPTVYGESVSLRLLRRGGALAKLHDLGMSDPDIELVAGVIHRPNGIVLVTGPTGSGKSTTLYAFLHEINRIDQRIMTAEDPIEYEMKGINQVLVRPDIGLTFAKALRSFLRQDPDVIMVGEIRDFETAEIAIQASLTGHLVFSTLHTNDAAGAFTRLLDMGVEPFLVASAVSAVVAQRLVRRLCGGCSRPVRVRAENLKALGLGVEALEDTRIDLREPVGCESCRRTGFNGRIGIFEMLNVTDEIESAVIQRRSMNEIKHLAVSQGMRTLREDGWEKSRRGVTTIEEIVRVTEEEEPPEE